MPKRNKREKRALSCLAPRSTLPDHLLVSHEKMQVPCALLGRPGGQTLGVQVLEPEFG